MNPIETGQLTRRFGRQEAVVDLDLQVRAGSVTALLGANGAGKSTTLKLLLNLLRPSAGCARVLGRDSRTLGPAELAQVGYVSENQRLPDGLTVQQFADYCRPLYPTWDRELERELRRDFDLPPDRPLRQLSRGMAMKAALLTALAHRPKVLILDEPFSGLDPMVREELGRGILAATAAREWTILISTHDIEEVERLADRVILLDRGRKQLDEAVESLQARFRRIEVTGAAAGARPPSGAWQWAPAENYLTYIEPEYNAAGTAAFWRGAQPAAAVSARPLSLREIFLGTAREQARSLSGSSS